MFNIYLNWIWPSSYILRLCKIKEPKLKRKKIEVKENYLGRYKFSKFLLTNLAIGLIVLLTKNDDH